MHYIFLSLLLLMPLGSATRAVAACEFSVDGCKPEKSEKTVAGARQDDVVRLSPIDLAAQTHKWEGKTIETTLRCFYADINEFRCTGNHLAQMRIDFADLQPAAARAAIERNCDTVLKAISRKCLVTLRFVYSGFTDQETGSLSKITMVVAKDNLATIVSGAR